MQSTTVSSAFVINMLEGATSQGHDTQRILIDSNISPYILNKPRSRVTFQQYVQLSQRLLDLMGDENFGLIDNKVQHINTFKLACYSAINADDVGQALDIFAEFMNIIDNGLQYSIEKSVSQTLCKITRSPSASIKNPFAIEQVLISIHRTLCWISNIQIPILRVDLDYPAPRYNDEYRYFFYGAPAHFEQPQSALLFSTRSMKLPNLRNMDQLKNFLLQIPLILISQTNTDATEQLSARIRSWLERQIAQHQYVPDINAAADQFELHPQAIRRRLKKEQTSYQTIKMEIRRDIAIYMISGKGKTMEEIATSLDFSEASAFVRAFKQWTGLTPLAFRKLSG